MTTTEIEKRTKIADRLFFFGGILAGLSLVPAVFSPETAIPRTTSLPTTLGLGMFLVAQIVLKLKGAAIMGTITLLCWLALLLFRAP